LRSSLAEVTAKSRKFLKTWLNATVSARRGKDLFILRRRRSPIRAQTRLADAVPPR